MTRITLPVLSITLFLLCSCTVFCKGDPTPESVPMPKQLTAPVGKKWQLIEEAPNISDEHGRLPFQVEQSVRPDGKTSTSPKKFKNEAVK